MLKSVDEDVLTDKQLRDNVFTFFLAGHETTAGTLGFSLYSMAKHPEEQKKLLEDSKFVKGRVPTYEETQKFEYTLAFIREVMRMYSPVTLLPTRGLTSLMITRCLKSQDTPPTDSVSYCNRNAKGRAAW